MSIQPDIAIFQGHRPPLGPAQVRIVIDTIRAFTHTQVAFERGARQILLVASIDQARQQARAHPDWLLAGERDAIKPPDFDLGNSPALTARADLQGRTLVLTTSNGVQAVAHAAHDFKGLLLVTGLANAGSTLKSTRHYLDALNLPNPRVQILASHPEGDEDLATAQWIHARQANLPHPDDEEAIRRVWECRAAQKFADPTRPEYLSEDIPFCARRADAPFAMVVERQGADLWLTRQPL
ncbi:hypothetical protein DL240_07480 [Lujinxingia litoralis]|uniref:Probable 2-phosphosulfolactate phosphatase n=1 Tax=Lujinxingia litoralis TaxID=2211119 RepID=A0A328CA17_9DELT|nr:2-phosphosulfolactate phosphatase [Lujinxingia litoralis]RAL23982.1 hypothetical protein DL240_07480 [Lujinxingia litoralis]